MSKVSLGELEINKIYNMDCLEGMKLIPDKSIDAIICDLPYGTTKNKWDIIIPFEELWKEYERIIKDNGCIALFSSQPFTTDLINSNRKFYRYEIIWDKEYGTDFQLANKKPMKAHENIQIFYKKQPTYNAQKTKREKPINTTNWKQDKRNKNHDNFHSKENIKKSYDYKYPTTVIRYNMANGECNNSKRVHPTQKPVHIMEWLIKTYSNENEIILDNCIGSGTTAIAALNTKRKFIGFETESKYIDIANNRLEVTYNELERKEIGSIHI